MNLTSKTTVKSLLRKYGVRPLKQLGQNFLVDKAVLEKIIQAADLQPGDVVLEIGPGIGTLTRELANQVKKVTAIEKDPKMVEILKKTLKDFNNVEVIQSDILKKDVSGATLRGVRLAGSRFQVSGYKLIANLPYYIVSPVIRKFLESGCPPKEMILMVQKEVAQRITARPPKMSLLAVSVQFYAKPEIISFVSKRSFWPSPKVDSAIVRIRPRRPKALGRVGEFRVFRGDLFRVVRAGFVQPRKQLANNLSKELKLSKEKTIKWLQKNKIQPTQRAETLSVNDWIKLTKSQKHV